LEQRLGYQFQDRDVLARALTHPSAVSWRGVEGHRASYQRLEFLGDRVLGLVVADMLFEAFPNADEGDLHRRHASLVRKETCAEIGAEIGLGDALLLDEGEAKSGGRGKVTILGDACEAVIGALYRDGGLTAARTLIRRFWGDRTAGDHRPKRDPKSMLQEWAQAQGLRVPDYRLVEELGPPHAPRFLIRVEVEGHKSEAGEGSSKREAEQAAAARLLKRELVWKGDE
ncbi:MAG: ribonuclease III, partial [Alphaproteobacteria bacterium]